MNLLMSLLKKEIRELYRMPEIIIASFLFCLVLIVFFQFGFQSSQQQMPSQIFSLIWLVLLFGGILKLNRSFEAEKEAQLFKSLRLIPKISFPLFFSKIILNFVFMIFLIGFTFILTVFFFNLSNPLNNFLIMIFPLALGCFGFVLVGTAFSSMVITHTKRDLILPVILYPILIPLILAVLKSIDFSVEGEILNINQPWLIILIACDALFFILSAMVFENLLEN